MRILNPPTAFLLIIIQFFSGCTNNQNKIPISDSNQDIQWQVNSHAKFFRIGTTPSDTLLEIYFDTSQILQKFHKGQNPQLYPDYSSVVFNTRNLKIVSLTSAFSHFLDLLGDANRIIAVDQIDFWTKETVSKLPFHYQTPQIQKGGNLQIEKLIQLNPDLTFTYTLESKIDSRLSNLSKVICIQNHFEVHPLAKAEWIKVFGYFLNHSKDASELFLKEKSFYTSLTAKMNAIRKPKIMVNLPYSGIWWVPQKFNYLTQLVLDAGGIPIWISPSLVGNNSVQISTELGLSHLHQCDILLNPGSIKNINEISDTRISKTIHTQKPQVWQNDQKLETSGANSFWDIGSAQPHILLKDLQNIFYDQGQNTYFYRKINY